MILTFFSTSNSFTQADMGWDPHKILNNFLPFLQPSNCGLIICIYMKNTKSLFQRACRTSLSLAKIGMEGKSKNRRRTAEGF